MWYPVLDASQTSDLHGLAACVEDVGEVLVAEFEVLDASVTSLLAHASIKFWLVYP